MTDTQTIVSRISELNDAFRRGMTLGPGDLYITRGVESRGPAFVYQALTSVQDFDAFTPANDPFGEHDFGVVHIDDADTGADDPADPQSTRHPIHSLIRRFRVVGLPALDWRDEQTPLELTCGFGKRAAHDRQQNADRRPLRAVQDWIG